MILIYIWFFILLLAIAKFNKELIEDITYRTRIEPGINIVKENREWHTAQLVTWVLIFLMPLFVIAIADYSLPLVCEYGVRLFFFALMFSGIYNVALNLFRKLNWLHYGINDFLPTADLLIISVMGIVIAILYEIGALNFIQLWK